MTIHIDAGAVVINGVADADQLKAILPTAMAQALERVALQMGAG